MSILNKPVKFVVKCVNCGSEDIQLDPFSSTFGDCGLEFYCRSCGKSEDVIEKV